MFEKNFNIVELVNGSARLLSVRRKDKSGFHVLQAAEYPSGLNKALMRGAVTVMLPRENCVIRTLELKTEGAALQAEVLNEAEEGLPFEKEKSLWDSAVMSSAGGKTDVLFSAASSDLFKSFLKPVQPFEKQGLSIVPSTIGLFELLRLGGAAANGTCMAVYLSKDRFELLVSRNGVIIFSRGASLLEEPDVSAAVKAAAEALAMTGIIPDKVLSNSAELNEKLEKSGMKTALLALPPELAAGLKSAGADPVNFALCAGIASALTGHGALKLNLNSNLAQEGRSKDMLAILRKAGFAVSALFLVLTLVLFFMAKSAEKQAAELKSALSIQGGLSGRVWSRVLVDISKTVPSEVILNELSSDNKGDLTARGSSATRQGVTVFLENLNKLPGYSAELAFANDAGTGAKLAVQFQMKIRQRGEK